MKYDVAVIGGGLSGLAAAVELASHGAKVALIEQTGKLGGRCYSYKDESTGDVVDNGQHLLTGAYQFTLRYLDRIGTKNALVEHQPFILPFFHSQKGFSEFTAGGLPGALGLTAGLLSFKLLSLRDRTKLLSVGIELRLSDEELVQKVRDLTIEKWLIGLDQSEEARKSLWYPIAVSVMNELPEKASALLFARSLRATFLAEKGSSSLLIPSIGQTELYVSSAVTYLEKRRCDVLLNSEVAAISSAQESVEYITVRGGERIDAENFILAVPPPATAKLMMQVDSANQFDRFQSSPIVSIHLWFDSDFMEHSFIGLIGMDLQWLFNRRMFMKEKGKYPGYLSAVISAAYDYADMPREELVQLALSDINKIYPSASKARLIHSEIIKERRATFSAVPAIEPFRPATATQFRNLFLAGDWTATGLPATIEGAIQSGFAAAAMAMKSETPARVA